MAAADGLVGHADAVALVPAQGEPPVGACPVASAVAVAQGGAAGLLCLACLFQAQGRAVLGQGENISGVQVIFPVGFQPLVVQIGAVAGGQVLHRHTAALL